MRLILPMTLVFLFWHCMSAYALDPEKVIDREKMQPRGEWYEATVPDTLDLAERAKLSVNVLTGNVDREKYYAVYQVFFYEPGNVKIDGLTWNLLCKNVRALPKLRAMCGSDHNLDIEHGMMLALLRQIRDDGMMYYPDFQNEGVPPDTSYPLVNGVVAMAMKNWYERDGNEEWKQWIHLLASGLRRTAIKVEDRAYYPPECGYKADGTWFWNTRPGAKPYYPYTPPDEPIMDQQGFEGSIKFEQSQPIRALVTDYQYCGEAESLEVARKIARFCLKPGMWEDFTDRGMIGHEHGMFAGHFHANLATLYCLLDLAVATNDQELKQFVREAYENAANYGVMRIGWLPSWTTPAHFKRDASLSAMEEPCAAGDILLLASKLSDAGLGDYWDDVESFVRNHWAEQQSIDPEHVRTISGNDPKVDSLSPRFLGGFGPASANARHPWNWACCTANASSGLYYAWEGITRFDDGVATVNMFLNRASPWLDIDSYLPYEGKVVLKNKQARSIAVRIPGWLRGQDIRCHIGEKEVKPAHVGRYLMFENLQGQGEEIRLEFAIQETRSTCTIDGKPFTYTFRGSTVVDVEPRNSDAKMLPIYQRDAMRTGKAPMHTLRRFVAERLIPVNDFSFLPEE